jgi:xanthosine utilization system XapX-like protein
MSLHAVDDLQDAFAATRAFLWPPSLGTWLRLAVVAFFIGGASANFPTSGFQFDGGDVPAGGPGPGPDVPALGDGQVLGLVVGVVALVLLVGLLFAFASSVMEFVLVRSLREESVHVRRYFREHWRAGARLFGFRVALGVVGFLLVALPVLAFVFATGGLAGIDGPRSVLGLLLLLVPLLVVVGVVFALVEGFTTFFVVPVMLLESRGVLSAWRRFWRTLRAEWKEYLAFVALTFVLTLVAGVAVGFVVGLVAVALFAPLALVGVFGVITGDVTLPALALLGVLGLLAGLVLLFVAALVRVPVLTYFRYYALLVLGDTDPDLDLVPERRRAIRVGSGGSTGGDAGAEST